MVVALILVLVGVVYIGLRFSQRIAGPIFAFARTLAQLGRGDYATPLRLRQHDQFQNLAQAFNQTMEVLRARATDDIALLDEMAAKVGGTSGLDPAAREALLARIRDAKAAKERHLTRSTPR